MDIPLMEEGKEAPGPPKRFDLRTRLMELSPIVIIGVIIAAIAIGFIARDITVTREVASLQSRLLKLHEQVAQTKAMAAAYAASSSNSVLNHQLRVLIPQICKLECMNGGHPNEQCSQCTNCATGFGGRWCHVPSQCAEKCDGDVRKCLCRHGGELNLETCSCQCPPGYSGERCLRADTTASRDERMAFLDRLFNRSLASYEHSQQLRKRGVHSENTMLPNHLGAGVDGYTREMKVPVIQVSLPADLASAKRVVSPKTGRSYIVPDRVIFSASPDTTPSMRSEVFSSVKDYVAWAKAMRTSTNYVPGATLVRTMDDVTKLFKTYQTSFISVTQLTLNMFTTALEAPMSGGYETFQLEENCARALDYLPNEYNADSKGLYEQFLDYWGDSFAIEVVEGGMVESVHAVHKSVCKNVPAGVRDISYLSDRQKHFMGRYFGIHGLSMAGTWSSDASYEENASADSAGCAGGDPLACVETLRNKQDLTPWTQSLWDLPSAVSVKIRPITDLIRDPAKKAAMQAAVDARTEARTAAYTSTGRDAAACPPEFNSITRPRGWFSAFGTLECLRQGADCWAARGSYFKLCKIIGFNQYQMLLIIGCVLPDNATTRFAIPIQALGY